LERIFLVNNRKKEFNFKKLEDNSFENDERIEQIKGKNDDGDSTQNISNYSYNSQLFQMGNHHSHRFNEIKRIDLKYKLFPQQQYNCYPHNSYANNCLGPTTAAKTGMLIIGGNSIGRTGPSFKNKFFPRKGRRGNTVVSRKQARNPHNLLHDRNG